MSSPGPINPDSPRQIRIHSWISDQARLVSSPEPTMANHYLKVALQDQVRADSPILGFELERQPPAAAKDDRDKPLPVTPPLTPTSPQLGSPSHSQSQTYSIALPPSFTRLPIHPKAPIPAPKQTNHSPSSSIHSRTSASSLPYTHSLTMHTRTSSQSSLSSSPSLSRRPSLARQPSLPLLGETSILGLPPVPQSPQFQVQQHAIARSRSTSMASLSSLYHLPTGYEPASPQRRQSRYPSSQLQLQQNLSQSSLSGVLTPPSLGSVRDAVYLDSEEVRERLDELLAAAAIDEPGSVESYPGYVVDSYASKSVEGTEEDFGQVIEVPSPIQEVLEITSPDGEILAFPVPPLSPPLTPGYYQTPYASSSQIYLGPSTPPRPAPAPPLALDEDVVDEHVQELFFRPKTIQPAPTPVPSSSTTLQPAFDEKSRWSMSSSVDLPLGKKEAMVVEGGRRRSVSVASMQSKEKEREKEGKRKRLASFISRLGGAKEEDVERVGVLVECREEEEVQMPLTPVTSSEAHNVKVVEEEEMEGEGEVDGEELGEEWEEDLLLVKHAHTQYPVPDVVDLSFEPAIEPGALASARASVRDSVELRQERYRASLESDDEEEEVVVRRREEPVGRRSTDDWRRGSIVGSPRSSPASPQKVKPVQQQQQGRLRSMSSLSSLNLMGRMVNQIPPSPSPLPSATMTTAKPTSSLRTFITRMGLVSVPPPSPKMPTSVALPRRSLVLTQSEGKRKLVISGVEDEEAYDAVRRWCESFGEVRKFSRKRERGEGQVVVVDFKERKVADMVCRLQAQVHIKGAGSVNLSWVSKK